MDNLTNPIGKYNHKMGYVMSLDFADIQLANEVKEATSHWLFWNLLDEITDMVRELEQTTSGKANCY